MLRFVAVPVLGKDTPICQHSSNRKTIWQLPAGDDPIPALKIYIL
jgi:hypothetical protein